MNALQVLMNFVCTISFFAVLFNVCFKKTWESRVTGDRKVVRNYLLLTCCVSAIVSGLIEESIQPERAYEEHTVSAPIPEPPAIEYERTPVPSDKRAPGSDYDSYLKAEEPRAKEEKPKEVRRNPEEENPKPTPPPKYSPLSAVLTSQPNSPAPRISHPYLDASLSYQVVEEYLYDDSKKKTVHVALNRHATKDELWSIANRFDNSNHIVFAILFWIPGDHWDRWGKYVNYRLMDSKDVMVGRGKVSDMEILLNYEDPPTDKLIGSWIKPNVGLTRFWIYQIADSLFLQSVMFGNDPFKYKYVLTEQPGKGQWKRRFITTFEVDWDHVREVDGMKTVTNAYAIDHQGFLWKMHPKKGKPYYKLGIPAVSYYQKAISPKEMRQFAARISSTLRRKPGKRRS